MKKIFTLLLAALMLLGMCACTQSGNGSEEASDDTQTTTEALTTEAVTEEEIELRAPDAYTGKALPKYYKKHVEEQNAKVNDLLSGIERSASFVFFTDTHMAENRLSSPAIIASILENTPVKDVVFGGDVISSYGGETELIGHKDLYLESFGFAHPYFVRGNHDAYIKTAEDSEEGYFAEKSLILEWFYSDLNPEVKREEDKTHYYFDRKDAGVRYIVLDTNEVMQYRPHGENYYEVSVNITQEQVDWFIELLKNTPEGYEVVVFAHQPIHPEQMWYQPYCTVFVNIIEAFNKKTTVNATSQSGGFKANADFSGTNGKVLMCMNGHGHVDDYYVSDTGCVYYEVNDDSFINNGGSTFTRQEYTHYENALDVVVIDLDTGKIHCVRYGAGEDKTFGN